MQGIEFDSYIENGIISIPHKYLNSVTRSVRVIILPKEETPIITQDTVKKKLYSLDVDMTGFTFNRSEVNER